MAEKKIICVVNDPENPELNGKCFKATGESESMYTLEDCDVVHTVRKEYCKEYCKEKYNKNS